MATTRGVLGQDPKVLFSLAFTDPVTGAAADPTGTPTVKVYRVIDDDVDLKATLTLAKLESVTGWWGAWQDISDPVVWPAGDYQLLAEATVGGVASTYTDTFEIDNSAQWGAGPYIAGAYSTEAQIRGLSTVLQSVTAYPAPDLAFAAVNAAVEINMDLGRLYTVPFATVYPDTIILLSSWLSAANALQATQSQRGNTNELAAILRAQYDAAIADIYAGDIVIGAPVTPESTEGTSGILSSSIDYVPNLSIRESDSPLSRY